MIGVFFGVHGVLPSCLLVIFSTRLGRYEYRHGGHLARAFYRLDEMILMIVACRKSGDI
ncbi:hypothetical protein [Corynebacterium efficiens YS-314]|uniref:Uncharacterized protein n=1 Tax=Corynebacterium efficiens (strain DSM 44549 / YS-314 / AJ 12310 / JCM 11189 / NBRC 100395) TaxID=196164 RepID=Q8FTF3_COREF|nr:hypothetical protein [Corynebacterium efficiens YS-314]